MCPTISDVTDSAQVPIYTMQERRTDRRLRQTSSNRRSHLDSAPRVSLRDSEHDLFSVLHSDPRKSIPRANTAVFVSAFNNVVAEFDFTNSSLPQTDLSDRVTFIPSDDRPPRLRSHIRSSSSSAGGGESSGIGLLIEEDIPEDSIYRKLFACIPIIGIFPTLVNESSLKDKITKTSEPKWAAKLISVKNHYKIASIIRNILSLALIISLVALSTFPGSFGAVAGGFSIIDIALKTYGINKNKQLIKELQRREWISPEPPIKELLF